MSGRGFFALILLGLLVSGCLDSDTHLTTSTLNGEDTLFQVREIMIFVDGRYIRDLTIDEIRGLTQFDTGVHDGGGPGGVLLSDVLDYLDVMGIMEVTVTGKDRHSNDDVIETLHGSEIYDSRYNLSLKYTSRGDVKLVAPGDPTVFDDTLYGLVPAVYRIEIRT